MHARFLDASVLGGGLLLASVLGLLVLLRLRALTRARAALSEALEQNRQLLASRDELRRQAFSDSLTGLPNRELFGDRLQHALEATRRTGSVTSVLCLDLDEFKAVNDRGGHALGDELLQQVARRLSACVRSADTLARLGGDEFAVLLENVEDGASVRLAERILEAFAVPFDLGNASLPVSPSIGISISEGYGQPSDLLQAADVALYEAKRAGGKRYSLFAPAMHVQTLRQLALDSELRLALERREFLVHYQPILGLASQSVVGIEALVRWQHPTRGLLSPAEFIPAAERLGVIVPLGQVVLEQACRDVTALQNIGREPLFVSVNVALQQLRHASFVDDVLPVLERSRLDPALLMLELTETAMLDDVTPAAARLGRLRQRGVRVALDDFGIGYSSLSRLRDLPIDVLKIDKVFIGGLTRHADRDFARAIVTFGKTLHLQTVAEGIEEAAQVLELRALGCELGQGYHFAPPLPFDALERFIVQRDATGVHAAAVS